MAPGYLSVGLGLTYTPTAWLTVIVSPATYRATFVCNDRLSDAGAFGVKSGRRVLNEFGANIQLDYALTGWLTANLYVNMIYDDDILFGKTADTPGSPRLQIKEVLGIGFQVNF